jgi:uncharacterized protein (TIGR02266 family)
MSSQESRKDPRRKSLNLTVRYKSATVAEFVEDYSYDISRGGLFIKTTKPFPTGTLLKFEVRIGEEQTVIDGVGRVAWRRERTLGANKPAGMGIKFIRIADECVALIQKAVDQHEGADGQFEEGAREQGVFLSEPPVNLKTTDAPATDASAPVPRMFPSSSSTPGSELDDAGDQSMLFQSSELLKAALSKVSPTALPHQDDRHDEARSSAAAPDSAEAPSREPTDETSQNAEPHDAGPSGEASHHTETLKAAAPGDDAASHQTVSDGEEAPAESSPEEVSAPTTSEPSSAPSASNRPKTSARRKTPKKKKKKFNYTSLPAPKANTKPTAADSSQPVTSEPRASVSAQPFPSAGRPSSKSNAWLWALAAVIVGGGLFVVVTKQQAKPEVTSPRVNVEAPAPIASTPEPTLPTSPVVPAADNPAADNPAAEIGASEQGATAAPALATDTPAAAPSPSGTGANATSALADQDKAAPTPAAKQPRRTKKAATAESPADAPDKTADVTEKPADVPAANSPQQAAEAEPKTTSAANEPRSSSSSTPAVTPTPVAPVPTTPAPAASPTPTPVAPAPQTPAAPPSPTPTP